MNETTIHNINTFASSVAKQGKHLAKTSAVTVNKTICIAANTTQKAFKASCGFASKATSQVVSKIEVAAKAVQAKYEQRQAHKQREEPISEEDPTETQSDS